jgi:starch synthase
LQRKIDILEMTSETGVQQKLSSEGESNAENSDSQLLMEFDALKEENMLIKDDIKFLKTQLVEITETEESVLKLEKECGLLDASLRELECGFIADQSDMLKLGPLQHDAWWEKVENLEESLKSTAKQVEHAAMILDCYQDFQDKTEKIEASL